MCDDQPPADAAAQAGLAHVASASFLASRVVPTGGYAVALAGGVAIARAAQVAGTRAGYGASLAAMLQTVAVLGPARLAVPLTQAIAAPLLGRMHRRGSPPAAQIGACAAIRAIDQLLMTVFYISIIAGGLEAYAATYDAIAGRIPGVPDGPTAAIVATVLVLLVWTVFASVVQVLVYRAALRAWPPAGAQPADGPPPAAARAAASPARTAPIRAPRYDPRAVAIAAIVAFCVLIATTAWLVLAAVAAWLAVAWATARPDHAPVKAGLSLAALLAVGALLFGLVGGAGLDLTLQRTVRAGLVVLVATWLRAAAGEPGLREVARRSLWSARRVPAMAEASAILDRLGSGGALGVSARTLVDHTRHVPRRPVPLAAAVLRWVAVEAASFRAAPAAAVTPRLRAAWRDRMLVATVITAVAGAVVAAAWRDAPRAGAPAGGP
jgi:hypothetical protein